MTVACSVTLPSIGSTSKGIIENADMRRDRRIIQANTSLKHAKDPIFHKMKLSDFVRPLFQNEAYSTNRRQGVFKR
jgi:hypothetical protein